MKNRITPLFTLTSKFWAFSFLIPLLAVEAYANGDLKTSGQNAEKFMSSGTDSVNAYSGDFGYEISIEVPKFKGIEPKLTLSYNSATKNGRLGLGWFMSLDQEITRMTSRRGIARWETGNQCITTADCLDHFYFQGEQLLLCNENVDSPSCHYGGTHFSKRETYSRYNYDTTLDHWIITDTSGLVRTYAKTYATNQGTYSWGISSAKDTNGNITQYEWKDQTNGTQTLIEKIVYNGVDINFYYESRPDTIHFGIGDGFLKISQRLTTIAVRVENSPLRAYRLIYSNAGSSKLSKLISVQQFGWNYQLNTNGKIIGGSHLPPHIFTYENKSFRWELSEIWTEGFPHHADSTAIDPSFRNLRYIDVNADGLIDINHVGISYNRTYLNKGDGTWREVSDLIPVHFGRESHINGPVKEMDVNGDGLGDLVFHGHTSAPHYTHLLAGTNGLRDVYFQNNGDMTFSPKTPLEFPEQSAFMWKLNGQNVRQPIITPMDVNGDGLMDLLNGRHDHVLINRGGERFEIERNIPENIGDYSNTHQYNNIVIADLNGDGLPDLQKYDQNNCQVRKYYLNDGNEWAAGFRDNWEGKPAVGMTCNISYFTEDFNQDGLVDIFTIKGEDKKLYFNNGFASQFEQQTSFPELSNLPPGSMEPNKSIVRDINGDGAPDLIITYANTAAKVFLNQARPEYLINIKNPKGGLVSITYAPSSKWQNTKLPLNKWTAETVNLSNGINHDTDLERVNTTSYEYSGGYYDGENRRFLGFRHVKTIKPKIQGEENSPYTETWFFQDYGSFTKPEHIYSFNAIGELVESQSFTYTLNGNSLPYTSLMSSRTVEKYDGGHSQLCFAWPCAYGFRTQQRFYYTEFGTEKLQYNYGNIDIDSDDKRIFRTYFPNTEDYIVDRQASKVVRDIKTDQIVEKTVSYYDGQSYASSPTKGNITSDYKWVNIPTPHWLNTKYTYDSFGNILTERKPNGAQTKKYYNSRGLQVREKNALGHYSHKVWHPHCRKIQESRDINGQSTMTVYDPFCRLRRTTNPAGARTWYSYHNFGTPQSQFTQQKTKTFSGSYLQKRTYFDGLGQVWLGITLGDEEGRQIREYSDYNSRGKLHKKTLPHYYGDTKYWITTNYDGVDRPIEIVNPNGSKKTLEYRNSETTEINEKGQKTQFLFDALGRKIRQSEWINNRVIHTNYRYDVFGKLAEVRDQQGNTWTMLHDSLGRQIELNDPDFGTVKFEYDSNSNLVTKIDNKGQITRYEYDLLGRITRRTLSADTTNATTTTFVYDQARAGYSNFGKLTTMSDWPNAMYYDYNNLGQEARTQSLIDETFFIKTMEFTQSGLLKKESYSNGLTLYRRYNNLGSLSSVPGYINSISYNAAGEILAIRNANGTINSYTYDPTRELITTIESSAANGENFLALQYQRDDVGMITRIGQPETYRTFEYDDLNRVVRESGTDGSKTITYDDIGNITAKSDIGSYQYSSGVDFNAWHNTVNPRDVDGDGDIDDTDKQIVIDAIAAMGEGSLPSQNNGMNFLIDTTGDAVLNQRDVAIFSQIITAD